MTHVNKSIRPSEQGFTLVELAIVMVIIGLLIGGILKGQELINNAKVSATVTQLRGVDAAFNAFQDKYGGLPGDIVTPTTKLPNCAAGSNCGDPGDGNGRFSNTAGAAVTRTDEGAVAFAQLARADLLMGVDPTLDAAAPTFGGTLPALKAGGGMWIGQSSATGTATGITTGLAALKPYLTLNGTNATLSTTSGAYNPNTAAQIDRKLDDGNGNSGNIRTLCAAGGVVTATGAYDESVQNVVCGQLVRALN